MDIRILSKGDKGYPQRLIDTLGKKAPNSLYYIGNLELLEKVAIGFCGSRSASDKGVAAAEDCTDQIVDAGIVAVSGYAKGIDEAVHATALMEGGQTIVVMPEGINHFKIKSNLSGLWDWERVLVVSEFLPDDSWQVYRAMQRNRTIIGLSQAMIVVEAKEKGGTFEAGKQAISLGVPLFALSFDGSHQTSSGNRELQSKGAKPLLKSSATNRANLTSVLETISLKDKHKQMKLI